MEELGLTVEEYVQVLLNRLSPGSDKIEKDDQDNKEKNDSKEEKDENKKEPQKINI